MMVRVRVTVGKVGDFPALPARIAGEGSCSKPQLVRGVQVEFNPDYAAQAGPAERVCRRCPVAGDCLAWAVNTPNVVGVYSGVWFRGFGAPAKIIRAMSREPQSGPRPR